MKHIIKGLCYVVGDNIDTDQIIPAHYLTLSHTDPRQRREIARYAMSGLPDSYPPFVEGGEEKTRYTIIVAGDNFGCGSSRAQAPGCLNAAGVEAVIANYFARIFFRNSVNGGLLMPVETPERICGTVRTGDELEIRIDRLEIINHTQGTAHPMRALGAVRDILEAGDVFAYAKQLKNVT